jgi:hypothetical protein
LRYDLLLLDVREQDDCDDGRWHHQRQIEGRDNLERFRVDGRGPAGEDGGRPIAIQTSLSSRDEPPFRVPVVRVARRSLRGTIAWHDDEW